VRCSELSQMLEHEAARRVWALRLAREEPGLLPALAKHDPARLPSGDLEDHAMPSPRFAIVLLEDEVVDAAQAKRRPELVLGRLHRGRVGGASPVVLEDDGSSRIRIGDARCGADVDPPEVQAVGEADQVSGEAVPAYMRALPHVGSVRQGPGRRPSVP
jgi:hypothetical protein